MRRKRPEDVLLPPDLPQIEAIGIDVLNPPQFPAVYKFLELEDGRVIPEEMPDHQNPLSFARQIRQRSALRDRQAERLLHKHVFSSKKRLPHHSCMSFGWSRDRDGRDG